MVLKNRKASVALLLCVSLCLLPSFAQKTQTKKDEKDILRLVKASSIEMKTVYGIAHRISIDATFLHNGTYLKCDTADWDVDAKYIKAWGNVKVSQDKVVLSSDNMDYDIESSTAKFRSSVVQLKDNKNNILRTSTLDYCTKDSVAVFHDGGAMTMEDGQIIESEHGIYDTNRRIVNFIGNVNMYVDTVYVRTEALDYSTADKTAYFTKYVDFFREGDMLSSNNGWYNRETETFYFQDNVHCMSDRREAWCDSLYYFKLPNDIMMMGDAQVQDTAKHVTAVADFMLYESEIKQLTMYDNAAVALRTQQGGKVDTLYCGADTLIYNVVKFGCIEEAEKSNATSRKKEIMTDAVNAYRTRVKKEAADAQEKKQQEMNEKMGLAKNTNAVKPGPENIQETPDSIIQTDSTASKIKISPADSLKKVQADSIAAAILDSTDIGFVHAMGNVRAFREDMQMRCDSMEYNDLDSIARFFINPVIWNEGNRQYTSDSMFVLVRGEGVDRANLRSNAMIITQEDSISFDQIKSTEVMSFFNGEGQLSRFDAMGTAKAVFYLEENGALATVNVVESKILSGEFKDSEIDKIRYFDSPKNDAYPSVQLPDDLRRLKGFDWQPDRRPKDKYDITNLEVKPNEMAAYSSHSKPFFSYTKKYFPGGIEKVAEDLMEARRKKEDAKAAADTAVMEMPDSVEVEEIMAVGDSSRTENKAPESVDPASDSHSEKETEIEKEAESPSRAEIRRQEREAARKAKWEELDRKDALKAEAKRQKELAKKRKKTLKALVRQHKQDLKDARKLERYIRYYEKQKARRNKNGETVE